MANRILTGSRIRERRGLLGIKQSVLAQTVGISPAYLNLIEHNKRRIAGKLLTDIARALEVDPASLAEGAGAALVSALRDASTAAPEAGAEAAQAEEFADRFPGWAALVAAQRRRIAHLERTVANLSDRMAHDPHLAASLHELLSTVTAINATASILVEPGEIEAEWRDRFHRNIHEDSQRLAETSQGLVSYLESAGEKAASSGAPQEELEAWLERRGYHIRGLERLLPAPPEALLRDAPELVSASGRALALAWLDRYRQDAERLPLAAFQPAAEDMPLDPGRLADRFGASVGCVLRRLAALPTPKGAGRIGLVLCDGSGTLTFRKPVDGFALPRFGAACPLWPLYQALSRPMTPVRAVVEMSGRDQRRFLTYAVAEPMGAPTLDAPPVLEAAMLIVPGYRVRLPGDAALKVGTSCRICPHGACGARREPSILAEAG